MIVLPAPAIKRIHVNRHIVAANRRNGTDLPAYTVQTSKGPHTCRRVAIYGPMVFDQADKPLSCGARMYGVTRAEVRIFV